MTEDERRRAITRSMTGRQKRTANRQYRRDVREREDTSRIKKMAKADRELLVLIY